MSYFYSENTQSGPPGPLRVLKPLGCACQAPTGLGFDIPEASTKNILIAGAVAALAFFGMKQLKK